MAKIIKLLSKMKPLKSLNISPISKTGIWEMNTLNLQFQVSSRIEQILYSQRLTPPKGLFTKRKQEKIITLNKIVTKTDKQTMKTKWLEICSITQRFHQTTITIIQESFEQFNKRKLKYRSKCRFPNTQKFRKTQIKIQIQKTSYKS